MLSPLMLDDTQVEAVQVSLAAGGQRYSRVPV